jgi:hypothetical protein
VAVVDRIKTFVRSKSNERVGNTDAAAASIAMEQDSEYLKTIKLRMSRPTRMTVTDEINRINI